MPCWYYDKRELRHSPSIKAGLTLDQETLYRREGARFILQIGNKMGLRYETMATGVVFFHRFYMVHSFLEFPRHVTACCCLFLAGKVEETPKKCRDIMKTAKNLMKEDTWAEFGSDPREEVMTLERIILQTIKFDFIVEHPYAYLLKYAKCLKGDKKKLQNMVQMAWTFVNDSLCTTLCLQWEAEIIAIALMYLAGKLSKFEVTDWTGRTSRHTKWWDMYTQGITTDLLEDICHQVLDLYAPNKTEVAGGDAKRSSAGDRAAASTAASAASTRSQTQTAGNPSQALPQQPTASAQQQQITNPVAQQQQPSDKSLPPSANTSAIPTMPVPVITSSSIITTGKDDVDGGVNPSETVVAAQPGAGSSSSASFSQYGNYQYPGYNPSYPPPPPAAPQRYNYPPYQAPPAPTPPTTPHPPPSASTHYQAPPTTPRAPPPVTHYPPPVTPNTQAPPPSHYTPYSTTPSHPPPSHPPPYRLPPAPTSYTPQSMHPSPHYPPHAPPHNAPNTPYYPPRDANSPYNTSQNQYQNRSYYGSGS